MNFRYDINGLRAIAVIAVVLFHINPAWAPGGFSGVDVFFVISGFLMTEIIFRGLENDNFNLLNFYSARAKRIIPPLAALCLAVLVFGWFYLPPLDYKILGSHVVSSILFLSNMIYWLGSGYFDTASHEKWLLHTWSLSVEWQFYIIYPIVIITLKHFFSLDILKRLIVIGTILGIGFSVIITMKWPTLAYYLLPTRAWEMMIGGLAYLYPWSLSENKRKWIEIIGLSLIVSSYAFLSSSVPWPSYFALIPVLGAYFIIIANRQSSFITNNITFQLVGRWSYSIYLWHWPIVVYRNYFDVDDWYIYWIIISCSLMIISFKFLHLLKIEPLRQWGDVLKIKTRNLFMITLGIGNYILFTNGANWHYPPQVIEVSTEKNQKPDFYDFCFEKSKLSQPNGYCVYHSMTDVDRTIKKSVKAIVIGDSHASSIVLSVIESLNKSGKSGDVIFYGHPGCLPVSVFEVMHTNYKESCSYWGRSVKSLIDKHPNSNIFLSQRYSLYFWGHNEKSYNESKRLKYVAKVQDGILSLEDNAIKLKSLYLSFVRSIASDRLTIVGPVPEQVFDVPTRLLKEFHLNKDKYNGVKFSDFEIRNNFIFSMFNELKLTNPEIRFIEPHQKICNRIYCKPDNNGTPLYYDDDHLSKFGASYISDLFIPIWD